MSVCHDRLCELGLWKLFIVFCLQAELVLAAFAICFISAYLFYPIRREHTKLMELLGCLHSSAFFFLNAALLNFGMKRTQLIFFSLLSVTEICKTVLSACSELSSVMLSACKHGLLTTYSHSSVSLRSAEMSKCHPLHTSRTSGGKKQTKQKKNLLLIVVCTISTQLGEGGLALLVALIFPGHLFISQVMLTMLLSFWWAQHVSKGGGCVC